MDVCVPPLRDRPRDPALMRMQMEVPLSLRSHNKWVCRKSDTYVFADAIKAYRNHRVTFTGRPLGVMRAISFNDGQIS